jgi:hypothetical protein
MVINHQEYIKFQPVDGQDDKEAYRIVFEDTNTIASLIKALVEKLGEAPKVGDKPIDKEFLVILDQNHTECDPEKLISEYTSTDTTLTLDYKDHVVLQFTTLKENQVESKFKFIPFADVIKGTKIKLNSGTGPLKDKIQYDDVVSEAMKENVKENEFFGKLKFYWGSVSLNGKFAENFLKVNMPCMDTTVRVLLDRFGSKHNHYVIQMEDNWISKEFMS